MKNIQDLKNEKDVMSIFRDFEKLKQYVTTVQDLIDAISSLCLNDNQKLEITKQNYFKNLSQYSKMRIVNTITDNHVKSQIIRDVALLEEVFDKYNFIQFLETASEEDKIYVLNNLQIFGKFNISTWDVKKIIDSMSNENKAKFLQDKERIQQLDLDSFALTELIIGINDDEIKSRLSDYYELDDFNKSQVIKSFSDENKKAILLQDTHGLDDRYILEIISSLGAEMAIDFINNQQEFLQKKNIEPYQFVRGMPSTEQLQLINQIPEMQVPEGEKRRIFASLKNETKQDVDIQQIDEKYRDLIGIEISTDFQTCGQIIPDLDADLSQYKDLDELLSINPLKLVKSDKERQQLLQLCQVCPNLEIDDNLFLGASTVEEYIKGEEWVGSILQGIQEEWTDIQKLAYIDTAIGKKISYTPDFGTEVEDTGGARALWKIITRGYGVCNGIAQVEKYLLGRVGIQAELISGQRHSFVKIKNIAIPTENGIVQGDTLVDPTWNLTASRFGSMPQHFCKSYDELRKVDVDDTGKDHECHQNDKLAQGATINMDEKSLREVYKSIGIADKDGKFPIGSLMEQSKEIDESNNDMQAKINMKFALLKKWCPEFATCQNSTIDVLRSVLFENNDNFEFKRCIASRVYDRADQNKKAVLYVYMETESQGKQFFYADKQGAEFVGLSQEEFEMKFECYEEDMQKIPGNKRPWETSEEIQENSSGQVTAKEGR